MNSRHLSRQQAIQLLYNVEFTQITLDEAVKSIENLTDDAKLFAKEVLNNLPEIDEIISASLVNYTLNRLNAVDRAILRLATYELKNNGPKAVVINDALELTKEFSDTGDKKAVRFNNRLLDTIASKLN